MGRQGWGGGGVSERVPPRGREPCAAGCGWRILMAGVFACKRLGTVSVVIKLVGGGGGGVWARGRGRVFVSVRSPVSVKTGGGSRERAPRSLSFSPVSSLLSLDACRSSPFSAPLPLTSAVPTAGLALLPWVGCAQTFFLFLSLSLSFCTSARLPTPCRSSFVSC